MITVLFSILIGIAVGVRMSKDEFYYDFLDLIFGGLIGGFVGSIIGFFIALALPLHTYVATSTLAIESLQDNNSVNGRFFLGMGQIEGKMKYVFYYADGDVFKMKQIDYDKASIRYSAGKPQVVIKELVPISGRKEAINFFAFDLNVLDPISIVIEVPKGTIKNNFTLDAN